MASFGSKPPASATGNQQGEKKSGEKRKAQSPGKDEGSGDEGGEAPHKKTKTEAEGEEAQSDEEEVPRSSSTRVKNPKALLARGGKPLQKEVQRFLTRKEQATYRELEFLKKVLSRVLWRFDHLGKKTEEMNRFWSKWKEAFPQDIWGRNWPIPFPKISRNISELPEDYQRNLREVCDGVDKMNGSIQKGRKLLDEAIDGLADLRKEFLKDMLGPGYEGSLVEDSDESDSDDTDQSEDEGEAAEEGNGDDEGKE